MKSAKRLLLVSAALVSLGALACARPRQCDAPIPVEIASSDASLVAYPNGPIVEAVGCAGKIWVRTGADGTGALIQFDFARQASASRIVHFSGGVIDIHRSSDDELYALYYSTDRRAALATLRADRFVDIAAFDVSEGDRPLGVADDRGRPIVITERHISVLGRDNTQSSKSLRPGFPHWGRNARISVGNPDDGAFAYVGFDFGEFGGGVFVIDLHTGTLTSVAGSSRAGDGDPVTGIAPDHGHRGCVLIAVGHERGGGLLRACGTQSQIVFRKETKPFHEGLGDTAPFFGIASARDGYWAATPDTIFHFDGPGPRSYPLHSPSWMSGLLVTHDVAGVIVIWTDPSSENRHPLIIADH